MPTSLSPPNKSNRNRQPNSPGSESTPFSLGGGDASN